MNEAVKSQQAVTVSLDELRDGKFSSLRSLRCFIIDAIDRLCILRFARRGFRTSFSRHNNCQRAPRWIREQEEELTVLRVLSCEPARERNWFVCFIGSLSRQKTDIFSQTRAPGCEMAGGLVMWERNSQRWQIRHHERILLCQLQSILRRNTSPG